MSTKNSNDDIGNRTRDLPACSAVPQPTAPLRAPWTYLETQSQLAWTLACTSLVRTIVVLLRHFINFDKLLMDGKHVYEHKINQVSTNTEPSALNPSPICNYGRCIQSSWIINYLQLLSVQITETWLRVKWLLQNGSSTLFARKRMLNTHSILR
jgi:hypothetical protein